MKKLNGISIIRLALVLGLAIPQSALANVVRIGNIGTTVNPGGPAGVAGVSINAGGNIGGGSILTSPSVSLGVSLPGAATVSPVAGKTGAAVTSRVGAPAASPASAAIGRTQGAKIAPAASVKGKTVPAVAPEARGARPVLEGRSGRSAAVKSVGSAVQAASPVLPKGGKAAASVQTGRQNGGGIRGAFGRLRGMFDGSRARGASEVDGIENAPAALEAAGAALDEQVAPETEEAEVAEVEEFNPLDLRFTRDEKKKLSRSETFTSIRLINGSGSKWYWGQYMKDVPIRVLTGGRMQFVTRITDAETKEISQLKRKDFAGYYPKSTVWGKTRDGKYKYTLPQLRKRIIGDLRKFAERAPNAPRAITPHTEVRVLHFLPYSEARHLPENNDEPVMAPVLRKPVEIPQMLKGLHNLLPRLVFVDLRTMGDRISYELLEDMGKLQKAGVTFVLMSDKNQDEVDAMLKRGVTLKQRDMITKWKMWSLSNNGNTLYKFSGAFTKLVDSRKFSANQIEKINHAAAVSRLGVVLESKIYGLTMRPKRGVSLEALSEKLTAELARFGVAEGEYQLDVDAAEGTIQVRPANLANSMQWAVESLQVNDGLYLNNNHIMTMTRDEAAMDALKGALQAGRIGKDTPDEDLVEMSLAAMLGPYRENVVGDLAASASSIKSFTAGYMSNSGGFSYKIYMMLGHVLHTSLDWAIMVYNDTGKLPSKAALLEKAHEIWQHEDYKYTANMLVQPGETMSGYLMAMDKRASDMYDLTARMLEHYPIALGTELSNLHVVDRYKKGEFTHRDIFRGLYDLVVARKTDDGGLEVVVADFKTGQTPTVPLLAKDTQVLLYDFFARRLWPNVPVPYNAAEKMMKVVNRLVAFIYPSGTESPEINEWDRVAFEKFLGNVMNRLRKFKGIQTQEMIDKEIRKAELEVQRAERAAKRAARLQAQLEKAIEKGDKKKEKEVRATIAADAKKAAEKAAKAAAKKKK